MLSRSRHASRATMASGVRVAEHLGFNLDASARRGAHLVLATEARDVVADIPVCACDLARREVPGAANVNFVRHIRGGNNAREVHCMKYTVSLLVDPHGVLKTRVGWTTWTTGRG
jgi:hypothetical protein